MLKPKTNAVLSERVRTYFKWPVDNLLYAILLQAVRENDIDFLRHGGGREIWEYLRTCEVNN